MSASGSGEYSAYPAWCAANEAPISQQVIQAKFDQLGKVFGFQTDNVRNMLDLFMCQLDSRSSRMSCDVALLSLHSDYIGGENSNYRKWYFATQYNLHNRQKSSLKHADIDTLSKAEYHWKTELSLLTVHDYVTQVGLYLLIWGESNNLRFLPETICFIYFCAYDYYCSCNETSLEELNFLSNIVTPLYNFISIQAKGMEQEKDHSSIVGYDDINQHFWRAETIHKIKLVDGTRFMELSAKERWSQFVNIKWEKVFRKAFKERRSWLHIITNYNRIWIIHLSTFWYFTSFNSPTLYTKNYVQLIDNQPATQVAWTVVSLGGGVACLLQLFATLFDLFLFRCKRMRGNLFVQLLFVLVLLIINSGPSVYILWFLPLDVYSKTGYIIAIVQFVISVITVVYLSFIPPRSILYRSDDISLDSFTSSFPKLKASSRAYSIILWISIFAAKFLESYFFLTLSLRDSIRILSIMQMTRCYDTIYLGNILCKQQARFVLLLMYLADLILFFLDTYLWYIICNCIFSLSLSFYSGVSVFSPWRNIFIRLPERISSKIIYGGGGGRIIDSGSVADVWNAIILSMYREHILSIDQVNKLVYQKHKVTNFEGSSFSVHENRAPLFFVFQDDSNSGSRIHDFFNPGKESGRRISFFAQSLSSSMPEPIPITAMPSFTVLIPHYSEKIILSLKEIIKEDFNSKVSLLEYLKLLHPIDWENFVKDTKILTSFSDAHTGELDVLLNDGVPDRPGSSAVSLSEKSKKNYKNQVDDLPLYCVGFKSSTPEYVFRTRIWASVRTQSLYRTVSGFCNYSRAIKLLHLAEEKQENERYELAKEIFDDDSYQEFEDLSSRKFKLILAMQRYQELSIEEKKNAAALFAAYPEILVSYIEKVNEEDGSLSYFSCLMDVSQLDKDGQYLIKYRIKLSGDPILGDGKSDNQNHSIIFYRGEYIQVIDSNQDNYLEECLKIKSVLSEFEEYNYDDPTTSQYSPGIPYQGFQPVGIVGAREYIFSESAGVLGDIAASKEQTFGTLFARTLAEIGGKLHYGHPDFLNGIFMTTRGGISKGQKGLHLNEDIYAGMTCISRGGRIKHCDYYQCGKGRDLGFGTILNFTTKIGAGMGEQILSREHFFLGSQLPLDRFLSFYYAHPGFHLNNFFIMLSVELFMILLVNLGALIHESILCDKMKSGSKFTDIELPLGCYNLRPVLDWVRRYVLSVIICFFLSFVPLLFQELTEKGPLKAIQRILLHLASLSPLFEVFVCQIYSKALRDNLTFGGAKYIATGRGFATSRISFSVLYSRYATTSIYSGSAIFMKALFGTCTMWQPSLLWFWITVASLCFAPFLFNPHQFSWNDFFLDYRDLLRWLSRGNIKWHRNSWIGFTRINRSKFTGYKSKLRKGLKEDGTTTRTANRSSRWNVFLDQCVMSLLNTFALTIPYLFINSQNGVKTPSKVNTLLRLVVVSLLPLILNGAVIALVFGVSLICGGLLSIAGVNLAGIMAVFAHCMSIFISVLTFLVFLFLHSGNLSRTLCGIICIFSVHKTISLFISTLVLSRELKSEISNRVWWSGRVFSNNGLGFWLTITQLIREYAVKVIEMQSFSYDFLLCHMLLFAMSPFLLVPYIDKWHSCMLFWNLKLSFPAKIMSRKDTIRRRKLVWLYSILFFSLMFVFAAIICGCILFSHYSADMNRYLLPVLPRHPIIRSLIQPGSQNNNDTGANAPSYIMRATPIISSTIF